MRTISLLIETVQVAPKDERLQLMDVHLGRNLRIRHAGDDVHLVSHLGELTGNVVEIYPLSPGVHVTLGFDEADPHYNACPSLRP